MNISSVIVSAVSFIFAGLQNILGVAILVIPLITMRKPAEKTRKLLMLLSILTAGLLAVSSISGSLSTLVILRSTNAAMDIGTLLQMLLNTVLGVLGSILTLLFPLAANMPKKERPLAGLLLLIPVFQCVIVLVNSAAGMRITVGMDMPAIIPGIFCSLLNILLLVYAMIWYLTGQKRVLSLVLVIAVPIIFLVSYILSFFAARTYLLLLGSPASSALISAVNMSAQFFAVPMRMLFILLLAMGIRVLGLKRQSAAASPVYPNFYYSQQ